MITKTKDGKFIVVSKEGKVLSKHLTKADAEKRLKQIEYFKHRDQTKKP